MQQDTPKPTTILMDATTYQTLAGRTECDQTRALARIAGLPYEATADYKPEQLVAVRCLHSAIGMMNELGEICELLQKWLWYDKGTPDPTKLGEEYGDLLWYHAEGLRALKLQMSTLMRQNLAKLQARYPDRYTDQHALNRDPVKEAEAMRRAAVNPMAPSFAEKYGKPGETPEQTAARMALEINAAREQHKPQTQDEALKQVPGYEQRKAKLQGKRTRSQVLAERATVYGCCDRHADNKACDCLENALPDPPDSRPAEEHTMHEGKQPGGKPYVDNHGFGHADEKEESQ